MITCILITTLRNVKIFVYSSGSQDVHAALWRRHHTGVTVTTDCGVTCVRTVSTFPQLLLRLSWFVYTLEPPEIMINIFNLIFYSWLYKEQGLRKNDKIT